MRNSSNLPRRYVASSTQRLSKLDLLLLRNRKSQRCAATRSAAVLKDVPAAYCTNRAGAAEANSAVKAATQAGRQ